MIWVARPGRVARKYVLHADCWNAVIGDFRPASGRVLKSLAELPLNIWSKVSVRNERKDVDERLEAGDVHKHAYTHRAGNSSLPNC